MTHFSNLTFDDDNPFAFIDACIKEQESVLAQCKADYFEVKDSPQPDEFLLKLCLELVLAAYGTLSNLRLFRQMTTLPEHLDDSVVPPFFANQGSECSESEESGHSN